MSLIDVRKLELLRQVKVGGHAALGGLLALAKVAYVADGKGGVVTVLGGQGFAPLKKIALKPGLGPLRFTPTGATPWSSTPTKTWCTCWTSRATSACTTSRSRAALPGHLHARLCLRTLACERARDHDQPALARPRPKPIVQSFATGSVAPKAAGELPLADSMAAANIDAAVLVVNPADNTTYYYMEGMNAPASNYQSYGAAARAVTVVNRSLKETEPGVYLQVHPGGRALRRGADGELAAHHRLLLHGGEGEPGARRGRAHRRRVPRQEPRSAAGAKVPVRVRLSSADGKPQAGLKDVTMLRSWCRGSGARKRSRARSSPACTRRRAIPEHGAYSIHVASKTLKANTGSRFPGLRTARRHRGGDQAPHGGDEAMNPARLLSRGPGLEWLDFTGASARPGAPPAAPAAPSTAKVVLRDAPLLDASGKRVRLAQDVIGSRIAVVNFIYELHHGVPGVLGHLQQLQQKLGPRLGKEVVLVSITVDPLRDTPQRLREYAARYEAREAGLAHRAKPDVDSVLKGFGAYSARFEDHPAMVLVGDARGGLDALLRLPVGRRSDGAHRHHAGLARPKVAHHHGRE